tara:strand:- start:488 stop:916 length:429 start_codon:yes stop_codon:yes gene_type:complete
MSLDHGIINNMNTILKYILYENPNKSEKFVESTLEIITSLKSICRSVMSKLNDVEDKTNKLIQQLEKTSPEGYTYLSKEYIKESYQHLVTQLKAWSESNYSNSGLFLLQLEKLKQSSSQSSSMQQSTAGVKVKVFPYSTLRF